MISPGEVLAGRVREKPAPLECRLCGDPVILRPDKPGRIDECDRCASDIALLTADSPGVVLAEVSADDERERWMDRQGVRN